MDYAAFKNYRSRLSEQLLSLDDLNPYTLLPDIEKIAKPDVVLIGHVGEYVLYGSGVRDIIETLFRHYANNDYILVIPSDIYPVYFQLAQPNPVLTYNSYRRKVFHLPDEERALALITNPIVPEGKYLASSTLNKIDEWLNQSPQRWLIIDQVYDYQHQGRNHRFNSDRVINVGSQSKLALKPNTQGWAISSAVFPGSVKTKHDITIDCYANFLSQHFSMAWRGLESLLRTVDNNWRAPQTGYLSIINGSHQKLLGHGAVALPASVYGIPGDDASVLSCLSWLKFHLKNGPRPVES